MNFVVHFFFFFFFFLLATILAKPSCCDKLYQSDDYLSVCLPVILPKNDPYFSQFNRTCENFIRTRYTLTGNCKSGAAQQINGVTQMLDASFIYGSDLNTSTGLREFNGGRLTVQRNNNSKEFLPPATTNATCFSQTSNYFCYKSGKSE